MNRSRRLLVVAHCILNANAKIEPYADVPGVNIDALEPYLQKGIGIIQLPCPESSYLGMNRWGMTKGQYDNPSYRRHCRKILRPILDQLENAVKAGYCIEGILGIKGSPSCGVWHSCRGYRGGEIEGDRVLEQIKNAKLTEEPGVFIEVLQNELNQRGIKTTFLEIED